MGKSSRSAGKNQAQQTLGFTAASETSKMATASSSFTLEMVVIEIEKSWKSMAAELTASLNVALATIQTVLEAITTTVTKHTYTLSVMETALSTHSDNITSLEQ